MPLDAPFGKIVFGFGQRPLRLCASKRNTIGVRLLVRISAAFGFPRATKIDEVAHRSGLLAEGVDGDDVGLLAVRRSGGGLPGLGIRF